MNTDFANENRQQDNSNQIDHDRLFKLLLTTFFYEFVELFFPVLAAAMDRNSLEFLDKELFTDITSGDRREADLVIKVKFAHEEAFFVIHTENQSKPQSEFGRRMFHYFARLHEKYGLPVYPIAVFSYDAPKTAAPNSYEVVFPDLRVLEFHFRVVQLNQLNWRDYLNKQNPVAGALMAKMNIAPVDRPKVKLACLTLLGGLPLSGAQRELLSVFVDAYLPLNTEEEQVYQRERAQLPPEEKEKEMVMTTSWEQKGIATGLEQGLRQEATRMAFRILERRFGALPADLQQQINQRDKDLVEELALSVPDFASFDDARAWLDAHA